MADEITVVAEMSLVNGSIEHEFRPDTFEIDQSTARYVDKVLDIGTSEETISFDDISTKGYVVLRNLDATNYVSWGFTTGNLEGKLNAGEVALFRMDNGGALIAQANTATCKMQFVAYEN